MRYPPPGRIAFATILLVVFFQAGTAWAESAFLRSLLLPGSGQAHSGHYGKATLFASAAVISGVGLFIAQIHYDRAAERYNDAKRTYGAFADEIDTGNLLSYEEIDETYQRMLQAHDEATIRFRWRNAFLVSFIGSYVLNMVDVILSSPAGEDREGTVSLEMRGDSVQLVKSLRF